MGLPGVNIELDNGSLGGVPSSKDGIAGMILTGVTVAGAGNVTVATPYQLFSLADAIAIGITASGTNSFAHKQIKEFYDNTDDGSELWIMLVLQATSMEEAMDPSKLFATKLLDASAGSIRMLAISKKHVTTPAVVIDAGLDKDVDKAMVKAQALAESYASNFKPFRFIVDGKSWTGVSGDLKDYKTASFNRGAVLLSATDNSKNASVGMILGQLASLPVQRKISRVKNGALPISEAYTTDSKATEESENAWDSIHDKGYIFLRTFVGRSGYFFSSDVTATADTDDYSSMARGRVIDKAITIAYDTYVEEIDDEIEINDAGQIDAGIIKALQRKVESRIELQMAGEISGVKCLIDPTQNVLSTNSIAVGIKIRPLGYKSDIDILLGFENPATSN